MKRVSASEVERVVLNALVIIRDMHGPNDFPQRLHHRTPGWVKKGELFHIRIRAAPSQTPSFAEARLAFALIDSARRYHALGHWWCTLFLVMPDHVHAMLAFSEKPGMSVIIRNWKRATARAHGISWQSNYFDHRIRSDEESGKTWWYIRNNPLAKHLCSLPDSWPFWWSARAPPEETSSQ